MSDSSESFDPYYNWLGIPPEDQPANHYRLLGVRIFETNVHAISNAAEQRMLLVRQYQGGKYADASQELLNKLAIARICLLNPDARAAYDTRLRFSIEAAPPPVAPIPSPPPMAGHLRVASHAPPSFPQINVHQEPPRHPALPAAKSGLPQGHFGPPPVESASSAPSPWVLPIVFSGGVLVIGFALLVVFSAFFFRRGGDDPPVFRIAPVAVKGPSTKPTSPNQPPDIIWPPVEPSVPDEIAKVNDLPVSEAVPLAPSGTSKPPLTPPGAVATSGTDSQKKLVESIRRWSLETTVVTYGVRSTKMLAAWFTSSLSKPHDATAAANARYICIEILIVNNGKSTPFEFNGYRGSTELGMSGAVLVDVAGNCSSPLRILSLDDSSPAARTLQPGDQISVGLVFRVPSATNGLLRLALCDAEVSSSLRIGFEITPQLLATGRVALPQDVAAAPRFTELSPTIVSSDPFSGSSLGGRGKASRAATLALGGGSAGSEEAVARALKWLAAHQMADGGWSFDHRGGACQGRCRNQGSMAEARNGATGLALMAFLGAGETHKEGQYKQTIEKGLYYLIRGMKIKSGQLGELTETGGTMYSHGIATIALCEAYAMTHDKGLMAPAQYAVNHIVYAQDPVGGGWRYAPKQSGDTSVLGWQVIALKSAHTAYLNVPSSATKLVGTFLDGVAYRDSEYGYTTPTKGRHAMTAAATLSRMYLGWKHDHQGIVGAAKVLDGAGPDFGNLYYSYYATQVMRHYDGDEWKRWNAKMRDPLVARQVKTGHEEGSWHMTGADHGYARGGRLYCTALATMMLEVYYRHRPIYQPTAAK